MGRLGAHTPGDSDRVCLTTVGGRVHRPTRDSDSVCLTTVGGGVHRPTRDSDSGMSDHTWDSEMGILRQTSETILTLIILKW